MRRRRLPKKEEEPANRLDPAKARERVFQRAGKLLAAKQRSVEELEKQRSVEVLVPRRTPASRFIPLQPTSRASRAL